MNKFIKISGAKRQIMVNTLTGWIAMGCRVAIALVMVPFLLKSLGKDGYGLIGLLGVIVSFSTVADLGLRQALGRELSEKVARQDAEGFRSLSSTALALYLGIATVMIIVGWILSPWFVEVFKVGDGLQNTAVWMLRLYGSATLLLSFVTPVFTAGLQSFLRFDAMNIVQTFSGITSGILLFICISFVPAPPLVIWAGVMLSILLLDLLILWVFYRKWCFGGVLRYRYLNGRELKPLFHLGGHMYILQMTNALSERSDPLVISYFFGTASVALYQSGAKLSQVLRPLVLTLSTQIYPLTTRFHVLNQQDKQRQALILGSRYTFLMGLILSAGILLFAERFCFLWLSDTLAGDYMTVVRVMQLWAVANIFDYAAAMHWPLLLGMKSLSFALAVQVPSALFNIVTSIYLVGFTRWGIPGVLVATIITGLVRRPVVVWYVCRITGLSIKKYMTAAYVPPLLLFIALLPSCIALRHIVIANWMSLFLAGIIFGLYAGILLVCVERRLLLSAWREWRQK